MADANVIVVDGKAQVNVAGVDLLAPLLATATGAASQAVAAATKVREVPNGRDEFVVTSSDDRIIFHADEMTNATIDASAAGVASLRATRSSAGLAAKRANAAKLRQINHLLIYGQSLAYGYGTGPVLSGAGPAGALMFNGGVRPLDGGTDPTATRSSLVALQERNGGTNGGETCATGCAAMLAQLLAAEDLTALADLGGFLFSDPAEGGTPEAGLEPGTAPFSRLEDDITHAHTVAAGSSYRPLAMLWLQGESDQPPGNTTTAAAWQAGLQTLRSSAEAWFTGMIGSPQTLPLIMYQTATLGGAQVTGGQRPTISLAQLGLADDPMMAMCTPAYPFPYYGGSDIHLSALGQRLIGAYFGLALKRWLIDGAKPAPLRPAKNLAGKPMSTRSGTTAIVRFDVPSGTPLSLDLAKFPGLPSAGFGLKAQDGTTIIIQAVAQTGAAEVTITAASALPANVSVTYGWNGQAATNDQHPYLQGCLRDTAGDALVFDPGGSNWPMHNWCAIFEEVLL